MKKIKSFFNYEKDMGFNIALEKIKENLCFKENTFENFKSYNRKQVFLKSSISFVLGVFLVLGFLVIIKNNENFHDKNIFSLVKNKEMQIEAIPIGDSLLNIYYKEVGNDSYLIIQSDDKLDYILEIHNDDYYFYYLYDKKIYEDLKVNSDYFSFNIKIISKKGNEILKLYKEYNLKIYSTYLEKK